MANRDTIPRDLENGDGRISIWRDPFGRAASILLWPSDDTMDDVYEYHPWVEIPLDELEEFITEIREAVTNG